MKWVGLTGGMGTGKSTVGRMIEDRGFWVLSADSLVHELLARDAAVQEQIIKAFGPELVEEDGKISRERLAKIVFTDPARLAELEQILHPEVRRLAQQRRQQAEAQGQRIAFYEVPLLFEKRLEGDFDAVVVVTCSPAEQRLRLIEQRKLSVTDIENRLAQQIDVETKIRRADYVIENRGSLSDLARAVEQFLADLLDGYQDHE